MFVYKKNPVGIELFFLFQAICKAPEHVTENDL